MKRAKRRRTDKRGLMRLIEVAYPLYGPRAIARMTGYHYKTVYDHARSMGLRCSTTWPTPPVQPPPELVTLMVELGIAA